MDNKVVDPVTFHDGSNEFCKNRGRHQQPCHASVGLFALLGGRDNRIPSYPSFSIDSLRRLPIPDFAAVGNDARDFLSSRFKWLQDEVLLPFPQMNDDPARRQIDDAVSEALDLDPEWGALIRRALSEEPSVTNRRYGVS